LHLADLLGQMARLRGGGRHGAGTGAREALRPTQVRRDQQNLRESFVFNHATFVFTSLPFFLTR